jgi:hypothetical protein
MDYMFYKTIRDSQLKTYVISYDIVCQWSVHLRDRMFAFDQEFFLFKDQTHVKYLVPKFHINAHISRCRTTYSFNYTQGVGRTDGEAPERGWAEINPLAASTKEMGPGSRRDTLDYHFGDYNWRKVVGMGEYMSSYAHLTTQEPSLGATLLRKILSAATDMAEHCIAHEELNSTLLPTTVALWTEQVEAWEDDPTCPNPFEMTAQGTNESYNICHSSSYLSLGPTQAAVRRQLAEDEASTSATGKDFTLDEKVTPSVLIMTGIDIEAEQYVINFYYILIFSK